MTAKLEQSSIRAHAHTSRFLEQELSSSGVTEEVEPIHYLIHTTESESVSEFDGDPECADDDVYPLADGIKSTLVLVPRG